MATFERWWPGSNINGESSVILDIFNQIITEFTACAPPTGSMGSGSPSANWWLFGVGAVAGAQPYWQLEWHESGGNIFRVNIRYWIGLIGTLDPSFLLAASHAWPYNLTTGIPYATGELWRTRAASTEGVPLDQVWVRIGSLCASPTALVVGHTAVVYTDGARAGTRAGWNFSATYNPSASELAAGIRQLSAKKTGLYSGADDGTINAVDGAATIGSASNTVPVPVFNGDVAANAWNSWTAITSSVWQLFSPTSISIVTNEGDLNVVNHPAAEPAGPVTNIYNRPGVPTELRSPSGPTVFNAITTLPGKILALLESAGWFVVSMIAGGAVGSTLSILGAAPAALELAAGTEVALIAGSEVALASAFALPAVVTATTALVTHEANSALATYQQSRAATAQNRIAQAIEDSGGGLSPEANQALIDLAAAFKPGVDPDFPTTMYDRLVLTHVMLQAVAETRQELTLRAKGIEVEAMTGSLEVVR